MKPGLKVSDLTIWREGTAREAAIGPLSFEAEGGSAVGIVGESGSGKTMSLRAVMGLLRPASVWEARFSSGTTHNHCAGTRHFAPSSAGASGLFCRIPSALSTP